MADFRRFLWRVCAGAILLAPGSGFSGFSGRAGWAAGRVFSPAWSVTSVGKHLPRARENAL